MSLYKKCIIVTILLFSCFCTIGFAFPPPILRTSGYYGVRGERVQQCNQNDNTGYPCSKYFLKKLNTMESEVLISKFQFGPNIPRDINEIIQDHQVYSKSNQTIVYNLIFFGQMTPQRSFQILRVYKFLPKSSAPRFGPLSKYYFIKTRDENDSNNIRKGGITIRLGRPNDKYIVVELNTLGQNPISFIRYNEYTPDSIPGFDSNWFDARITDTEEHRLLVHGDVVDVYDLGSHLRLANAFVNIPDPATNAPCGIGILPECPQDQVRWITRHSDRCIQKNDCITPRPIQECNPAPNCTQHYRLVTLMNQDGCNNYYCDFENLDQIIR